MITERANSQLTNISDCSDRLIPTETISEMLHSLHNEVISGQQTLTEMNSKISEEKLKGKKRKP